MAVPVQGSAAPRASHPWKQQRAGSQCLARNPSLAFLPELPGAVSASSAEESSFSFHQELLSHRNDPADSLEASDTALNSSL